MIAMITCTTDITTHAHRKFCSLNCMMNVRVVTCKGAVVQGSQPVVRSQQEVETGGHLALFSTKPHTPAEEEDEAQVAESRKRAFEPQVFCIPTGQRPSVADHDLSDEWTKTSPAFRAYFKGSAAHKKVRVQFLRRRLPDVACLWLHLWYGMYRLITLTRYFRQIFFPQIIFTSGPLILHHIQQCQLCRSWRRLGCGNPHRVPSATLQTKQQMRWSLLARGPAFLN